MRKLDIDLFPVDFLHRIQSRQGYGILENHTAIWKDMRNDGHGETCGDFAGGDLRSLVVLAGGQGHAREVGMTFDCLYG